MRLASQELSAGPKFGIFGIVNQGNSEGKPWSRFGFVLELHPVTSESSFHTAYWYATQRTETSRWCTHFNRQQLPARVCNLVEDAFCGLLSYMSLTEFGSLEWSVVILLVACISSP